MKKNSIIELHNVCKTYEMEGVVVHALDDVSLTVGNGEFLSIIGPSGSGKSTLMHLIGCLDTPSSGKVLLDGQNISNLSENELARVRNKKIGFIFQAFNLLRKTNALTNVCLPLLYAGVKNKREEIAKKALEEVGLENRLFHSPGQLSGGEQQRVAIARALVNNPVLILADEPTGNLDTKSGQEILDIFKKLNRNKHTIIVVTHDLDIAKQAKRIIRIKDGRIV